jgi:hypothetical protein
MLRLYFIIVIIILAITSSHSRTVAQSHSRPLPQDTVPARWEIGGYIKNMQTLLFFNNAYPDFQQFKLVDTFLQDNLVHNRINVKWLPNSRFTVFAEMRNRLFFGDLVRGTPGYADRVDNANNDYFDLSWVLLDDNGFVLHTMLDRLYAEYTAGNWEVRLGRQRINWGISTVWNPNDIFNAFSFTDFDYEERPGSDALRVRYYTGVASNLELAVKAFDHWDEAVLAGLWKFNRSEYDFQVLAGLSQGDLALGGGWAGSIKNVGFKGEFTWFKPVLNDGADAFAATGGLDYAFNNSLYLQGGYLYNSLGAINAPITGLFNFSLSAKNLYPYRHAVFAQAAYPFTPLLNGGIALIYSPVDIHALFVNPTATLSIMDNWTLDMVGQLVFNTQDNRYTSPIQAIFVRLKFNY